VKVFRWFSRSIATAALAVTGSVAANQVLNHGSLNYRWLGASLIVFVLAETMADVVGPRLGDGRPPAPSSTRTLLPRRRKRYLRQLEHSVRDMETMGIATQSEFVLELRQVYVDVSLVPQPPQDTAGEPYVGMIKTAPAERRTLSSFLERSDGQVFTAIGGPGSGKTTLVRRTALDLCRWSWSRRRRPLPMVIYLRDHASAILSESPPSLAVVAASAGWTDGKVAATWFERRLDSGGCLVMLDGLDEVADESDRAKVVGWTEAQIQRFPRNDYVITSRPHGYLSNPLPSANVLQVRRFTGEQISIFLHGWYYAIECHAVGATGKAVRATASRKADDLLDRLRRQPALYDLAANPLLLTMIANVHRYRDALPGSRAALYGEMCEVLLHRRQESKGLTDPTGLRGPQKEHVVCALAWQMMTAKIRDIPTQAACDAVEPVLSQVSRKVTPADFLDEARKSGLLIEREHGVYAFAHLTLQEYLAAAHIGEPAQIEQLTAAVDDPWWRETTLLWAAGADSTPVINACLASNTVRALSLAFDCADEALMVDPDVGQTLEAMLTAPNTDTDGRGRLITGVKAARSLRDVIWLGEGTTVCARPVGQDLYAMFTRDERAAGRHTPGNGRVEGGDDVPAVGMWSTDAARFVTWLNSLFDAGTTYRLPTPVELGDPAIGLITDLDRYTVWVEEVPRPRLYQAGAASPYAPEPGWLRKSVLADRERITPYLRLTAAACVDLDLDHVITYSRALTVALALAPVVDRHPDLGILDLVLNLALAHALDTDREASGTRDLDLDLALDLALGFAGLFGRTGELDRALDVAGTLGLTVPFDRFRAKHRSIRRAFEIATELRLNPQGLPHFAGEPDRTAILKDVLSRVDSLDFAEASGTLDHGHVLEGALTRANAFAGDADRARRYGRHLTVSLEPSIARTLERELAHEEGLIGGLDLTSGVATLRTAVLTIDGFARLWTPARTRRSRTGALLDDFDNFVSNLVPEPNEAESPVPEDPVVALQNARDLMDAFPRHALTDVEKWDHARLLAEQTEELIAPVLSRTAAYAEFTLACARLALYAAAALVLEIHRDDVATHLLEAVRGLVALHERATGDLTANEVLILVRI
jgi:hypothetical protein